MHHFKNTDTASTIKASVRAAQIGGLEACSCNTGAAVTCNVTKIEYKDRFRYSCHPPTCRDFVNNKFVVILYSKCVTSMQHTSYCGMLCDASGIVTEHIIMEN